MVGVSKKRIHLSSVSANASSSRKPSFVLPPNTFSEVLIMLDHALSWSKGHEQFPFFPDYERPSGIG